MEMSELREIGLLVIDTQFKSFFTIKRLRDKIVAIKLGIPESEVIRNGRYNKMKDSISKQLIPIVVKLRDNGYITKYSKRAWEIKKRGFI